VRTIPRQTTELTTTEGVLLGLLAEGERSGYDLLKRAEASVAHMWAPAKSQLYAVLPRLVDAGLARRKRVRQTGRPDKQVYRLTTAGRRSVVAWLEHSPPRTWDEVLLKVFFARLASEQRDVQVAQLEEYGAIERAIAANPDRRFGYLTLRFGLALIPARLDWLDEAIKELST
jgi:DNA-binding PadR family transcriptional regulator